MPLMETIREFAAMPCRSVITFTFSSLPPFRRRLLLRL